MTLHDIFLQNFLDGQTGCDINWVVPTRRIESVFSNRPVVDKGRVDTFPPHDSWVEFTDEPDYAPKSLHLDVALAGYTKDRIKIQKQDQQVTVIAQKEEVKKDTETNKRYESRGIAHRSFEFRRSIHPAFNTSEMTAKFEDGMLHLVFPIKEDFVQNVKID